MCPGLLHPRAKLNIPWAPFETPLIKKILDPRMCMKRICYEMMQCQLFLVHTGLAGTGYAVK